MTHKRYIALVVSILHAFFILNVILWHCLTKPAFTGRDINRLGSINTPAPMTDEIHYSKHHIEFADYIESGTYASFDVLTIGDSFTNGTDGGSYPDYLVNQYGLKVLNARFDSSLATLYMLNDSGWLGKISPRVVIIECVGRYVQNTLGRTELNADRTAGVSEQEIARIVREAGKNGGTGEKISSGFLAPVMFRANINFICDKIYNFFNRDRLSPLVYIAELDRPFFTNPGYERNLMYYHEDLRYMSNPPDAAMINHNLNNAARILKAGGIKLIFFIAADKYDLYSLYVTDKKGRPENPMFRAMREIDGKEYVFVDAMEPLRAALERGEQDVYWLTDTHWSHRGIKIFCDELVKYILP